MVVALDRTVPYKRGAWQHVEANVLTCAQTPHNPTIPDPNWRWIDLNAPAVHPLQHRRRRQRQQQESATCALEAGTTSTSNDYNKLKLLPCFPNLSDD
jgi:hypothetical protein